MFEFTSTTLWNGGVDKKVVADAAKKQVSILRQGVYQNDANHHICLYWTKGHNAYLDTIDLTAVGESANNPDKNYRLAVYVRSDGNADPRFANDLVHKGAPLFVEFKSAQADPEKVIGALVENLNRYQNATIDTRVLIAASAVADGKLADGKSEATADDITKAVKAEEAKYIVGANEYIRIHKAVLEEYDEQDDSWKKIVDLKDSAVYTGAEGFGTFEHLEKDYRLPTAGNLRWKAPHSDELPRPGVLYDQITIHYTVHRGMGGGMGAVGQQVTSETTHVFWIPADIAEKEFVGKFTAADNFDVALEKKEDGKVVSYT